MMVVTKDCTQQLHAATNWLPPVSCWRMFS